MLRRIEPAGSPARYEARVGDNHHHVAVDGDVAVAVGNSSYTEGPGGSLAEVFDNCFLLRFDAEGRCREFTEWFVKRPLDTSFRPRVEQT